MGNNNMLCKSNDFEVIYTDMITPLRLDFHPRHQANFWQKMNIILMFCRGSAGSSYLYL